jgi:hypothetical protein
MPRYFFQMSNDHPDLDPCGVDIPDIDGARATAIKLMGHTLVHGAEDFWSDPYLTLSVADDSGVRLFRVSVVATDSPPVEIEITPTEEPMR